MYQIMKSCDYVVQILAPLVSELEGTSKWHYCTVTCLREAVSDFITEILNFPSATFISKDNLHVHLTQSPLFLRGILTNNMPWHAYLHTWLCDRVKSQLSSKGCTYSDAHRHAVAWMQPINQYLLTHLKSLIKWLTEMKVFFKAVKPRSLSICFSPSFSLRFIPSHVTIQTTFKNVKCCLILQKANYATSCWFFLRNPLFMVSLID